MDVAVLDVRELCSYIITHARRSPLQLRSGESDIKQSYARRRFSDAEYFDWETSLVLEDTRRDYGEKRFVALGSIGRRIHVMVFSPRGGAVRLISLRKANKKEIKRYEEG